MLFLYNENWAIINIIGLIKILNRSHVILSRRIEMLFLPKNKLCIFGLIVLIILPASVCAALDFNTGDAELDLTLKEINLEAKADLEGFKADLSLTYNISQNKLEYLFVEIEMEPADVYMTLELSEIANTSVDDVVNVYKENRGKGVGVIAKELGIKPGSDEFMALKNKSSNRLKEGKGKGQQKKK